MSFGSIWLDALFGLACAVFFGAWLDHRKHRLGSRKAPPGPYASPDYQGGMKRPPAPLPPCITVPGDAAAARERRLAEKRSRS